MYICRVPSMGVCINDNDIWVWLCDYGMSGLVCRLAWYIVYYFAVVTLHRKCDFACFV